MPNTPTIVDEELGKYLASDGVVAAMTNGRIRPVRLRQTDAMPAIRWQRISGRHIHFQGGRTGLEQPRIQVDCYASTYSEAKQLATAVRHAIYEFAGVRGDINVRQARLDNDTDGFENVDDGSDEGRYRVQQDWLIWSTEATSA